ncbi:MAG: hypothetical protein AAF597_19505, partial [Bacteroidota bacterium]
MTNGMGGFFWAGTQDAKLGVKSCAMHDALILAFGNKKFLYGHQQTSCLPRFWRGQLTFSLVKYLFYLF